jgi:hypothetical protein
MSEHIARSEAVLTHLRIQGWEFVAASGKIESVMHRAVDVQEEHTTGQENPAKLIEGAHGR